MVADGGFALAVMSVPTVGKRVFLRVVSAILIVMHGMTPSSATVKKRPLAVQKVRLSPVQKQLLIGGTLQTLPNGLGFLCRALALLWQFLTWSVRVGNGASGWGKNKKGTPLSPNLC